MEYTSGATSTSSWIGAHTDRVQFTGEHVGIDRFVLDGAPSRAAERSARIALGPLLGYGVADPMDFPLRLVEDARRAPESFELHVTEYAATVIAGDEAGTLYGCQALRDLLPARAWRNAVEGPWLIPTVTVQAAPVFRWRGAMLDVSRHILALPEVLRFIDLMAMHRLNRLHVHLTDDQGWRVESRLFPRLNEVGSWRARTLIGSDRVQPERWNDTPHGGFFTIDDLQEITAYAHERAIVVVPEIDLPGHSTPLLKAIPELRVPELRDRDDVIGEIVPGWGVFKNVVSPLPQARDILAQILGEVCDAVDSPYLHVGGDECELDQWRSSAAVTSFLRDQNLGSISELRAVVNKGLCETAAELGRRPIVWDEAFADGGLTEDAIVMIWRSRHITEPVVRAGFDAIMAPVSRTYINYPEVDHPDEPLSIGGALPTELVASWNARADALDGDPHVLGLQGQLWSEYFPTMRDLEYSAFPRLSVLAATAWGGGPVELDAGFDRQLDRLAARGVNFRPPEGPRPWQRGGSGVRAAAPAGLDNPVDADVNLALAPATD